MENPFIGIEKILKCLSETGRSFTLCLLAEFTTLSFSEITQMLEVQLGEDKPSSTVTNYLNDLIKADLILHEGSTYQISTIGRRAWDTLAPICQEFGEIVQTHRYLAKWESIPPEIRKKLAESYPD